MICSATKKNGQPCTYRAKVGEFCGIHAGSEGECPICYDNMPKSNCFKLGCGHCFHRTCIKRWLPSHQTCPLCRAVVSGDVYQAVGVRHDQVEQAREVLADFIQGMRAPQRVLFVQQLVDMRERNQITERELDTIIQMVDRVRVTEG